jgi:hypothetical protein
LQQKRAFSHSLRLPSYDQTALAKHC